MKTFGFSLGLVLGGFGCLGCVGLELAGSMQGCSFFGCLRGAWSALCEDNDPRVYGLPAPCRLLVNGFLLYDFPISF